MAAKKQLNVFFSAAIALFCLSLIFVGILKFTKLSDTTLADEICVATSIALVASCVTSYLSLREGYASDFFEKIADFLFLGGMLGLLLAVTAFAYDLF